MSTEVELSFRAEKDLDDILAWMASRSPQGARMWLARWKGVCRLISERPESCLLALRVSTIFEGLLITIFEGCRIAWSPT
jgi:plasmid stabilization system protein ParE